MLQILEAIVSILTLTINIATMIVLLKTIRKYRKNAK
jgi:hypothetical protein